MFLALKIAFNLKELTYQQNVRKFFFSRFKRRLIKKSIIEKLEYKIEQYLDQTNMLIRARGNKFYMFFYTIINSSTFKLISILAIISNVVVLGLVKDNSSQKYDQVLEYLNLCFFSFFVFELVAKIIGQGFKYYLKDKFNWFDGGVVLISAIDVVLQYSLTDGKYHLLILFRGQQKRC